MNALVKKEIRLLLPSLLASLLMALAFWLVQKNTTSGLGQIPAIFPLLFCPVMLVMMTLGTFGREFSLGTFPMLLAQPIPRARIWWTKTLLLAGAVVLLWFVWCYSCIASEFVDSKLRDLELFTALFGLAMYSGGLWSVLLFRQVAAGFWVAALTPAALYMTIVNLLDNQPDKIIERVLTVVFLVYGIAGFLFAWRLFLRAQDAQWTGGDITLPEMRGLARFKIKSGLQRHWRPRVALLLKEFQLHQAQFVMAGALALLHLGIIATRKLGRFEKNSTIEFVLETFWALWLVMPLLVGCAAVAEERKIGMLESQLCLPVKRRTQFGLKVFVVMILSVALGTLMPLLLEGTRILPEFKNDFAWNLMNGKISVASAWGQFALNLLTVILFNLPLIIYLAMNIGMGAIAFYASTLSRNTLQTLAPAVVGILLAWFFLYAGYLPEEFIGQPLWRGPLIYLIAVPVLAVVLAALAYGNYKRVFVGWSVWRKNLLTLAITLTLVSATTSAIYHRVWELLKPTEPPHGLARLTPQQVRLQVNGENLTVFLPDGRVWMNRYSAHERNPFSSKVVENPMFGGGKFLEGSNWLSAADCWRDIVGIQRDGSLWVSEKPNQRLRVWHEGKLPASEVTKLARFGTANDWKKLSCRYGQPFLLKTNGTLWTWGTNNWQWNKKWPGLRAFQPGQLGTNADWADMFTANGRTFFREMNGKVWAYPSFSDQDYAKLILKDHITFGQVSYYPTNNFWRNDFWCEANHDMSFRAGIGEDGTFREIANWQQNAHTKKWGMASRNIQIGTETNWLAAIGGFDSKAVTLKADGTLWQWNFESAPDIQPQGFSLQRFSEHSDWVAIDTMLDGFVSLAADGSLWLRRFEPGRYYRSDNLTQLLANSRKPQFLGNIFDKAN